LANIEPPQFELAKRHANASFVMFGVAFPATDSRVVILRRVAELSSPRPVYAARAHDPADELNVQN
jgi:hypothetical protein